MSVTNMNCYPLSQYSLLPEQFYKHFIFNTLVELCNHKMNLTSKSIKIPDKRCHKIRIKVLSLEL